MNCNFDVDDAVKKLEKLGLVVRVISPLNFLVFNLGAAILSEVAVAAIIELKDTIFLPDWLERIILACGFLSDSY